MGLKSWLILQVKLSEKMVNDYLNITINTEIDNFSDYTKLLGKIEAYKEAILFLEEQEKLPCKHEFISTRKKHELYKTCRKCGSIGG
jgi:hypothetical protein